MVESLIQARSRTVLQPLRNGSVFRGSTRSEGLLTLATSMICGNNESFFVRNRKTVMLPRGRDRGVNG